MADASARLERETGAPVLFVNGAAGDVSPRQRGWPGVESAGAALASAALAAWRTLPPGRDLTLQRRPEPGVAARPRALGAQLHRPLGAGGAPDRARLDPAVVSRSHGCAHRRHGVGDDPRRAPDAARSRHQDRRTADLRGNFRRRVQQRLPRIFPHAPGLRRSRATSPAAALYGENGGETVRDSAIELLDRLAKQGPRG